MRVLFPNRKLELGVVGICGEGKPEILEEKPLEQGDSQRQTQPTFGTGLQSNPGCIGRGRALLPLLQTCFQ